MVRRPNAPPYLCLLLQASAGRARPARPAPWPTARLVPARRPPATRASRAGSWKSTTPASPAPSPAPRPPAAPARCTAAARSAPARCAPPTCPAGATSSRHRTCAPCFVICIFPPLVFLLPAAAVSLSCPAFFPRHPINLHSHSPNRLPRQRRATPHPHCLYRPRLIHRLSCHHTVPPAQETT